jgi:hypothetical protein
MRHQLSLTNIDVGTQSKFNQIHLNESSYHLPIPITEQDLLTEYTGEREGVLFIGRWEEGKNPELYLDLIEQTKLPARIMTNSNGAKKFEERLKQMGADYKIAISVIGQEKVDFITRCRVAFNPSIVESYGMAFYEQHIQMPTFVLEDQRWTNNFNKDYFFTTSKKNMAKDILDVYNKKWSWYESGALTHAQQQEANVFCKWNECFNDFDSKKSNTNTAKICNEHTIKHIDFITNLKRSIICIDDVRSVLTNKHKFRVIYTDEDTYLTKDPNFEPVEESTSESLFTFA